MALESVQGDVDTGEPLSMRFSRGQKVDMKKLRQEVRRRILLFCTSLRPFPSMFPPPSDMFVCVGQSTSVVQGQDMKNVKFAVGDWPMGDFRCRDECNGLPYNVLLLAVCSRRAGEIDPDNLLFLAIFPRRPGPSMSRSATASWWTR